MKKLEQTVVARDKEIKRLESINLLHVAAEKKRDEMIRNLVREISNLKQSIVMNNTHHHHQEEQPETEQEVRDKTPESRTTIPSMIKIKSNKASISTEPPKHHHHHRPNTNAKPSNSRKLPYFYEALLIILPPNQIGPARMKPSSLKAIVNQEKSIGQESILQMGKSSYFQQH